ncbi:MAG: hypothetical protein GF364_04450, partial [Candidatus Lokiarchaeota archaeon]|nr:hypothetical protein [Candidatus Lokiarchaeota archaeon]
MNSGNKKYQVLIFGENECVKRLVEYLGYDSASPRHSLVYFEFPTEKFKDKKFLKLFNYRLKTYVAQPSLLEVFGKPEKQIRSIDALIMLYSNNNPSSFDTCFKYFKKFAEIKKGFVPLLSIGYNKKEKIDNFDLNQFFFNINITKAFGDIFDIPTLHTNIFEDDNDALFFVRIKELLRYIDEHTNHVYNTITIERMISTLRDRISDIQTNKPAFEDGISVLGEYEHEQNIRITRHSLVAKWGLRNYEAKKIINFWEKIPNLEHIYEEERVLIESDAKNKLRRCIQLQIAPNLVNFLILGYDFYESKKALTILQDLDALKSITFHIPSIEYKIYDNLKDFVVISRGRTVYLRSATSTHDDITMFSGLIQTIEIVRNKYMGEKSRLKRWLQINDVDCLNFGNLHAIIGNDKNDLKVIIRFEEQPQQLYIDKTKEFLTEFKKMLADKMNERVIDLKKIRPEIDQLYYIH